MTEPAPRVSVIVCSLNGEKVLPLCLNSLAKIAPEPTHEIIVVDNGSSDATPEIVRRDFPGFVLIQTGRNLGFAGGNNAGMLAASGEIMVLLNDDTEVPADWLARLAAPFDRDPKIAAAGCKLLYPDGKTIQHAGGKILANGNTEHLGYGEADRGQWDEPGERFYVTGAALALRRAALEQTGLLDPEFFPIYFEEVDLQKRLAGAGWKIRYEPAAKLIHFESQSQGLASARFVYRYTRNRIRYLAMHGPPQGWGAAFREEKRFFRQMKRDGHAGPMLKAYAAGAIQWLGWRMDRRMRRTIPRLARS